MFILKYLLLAISWTIVLYFVVVFFHCISQDYKADKIFILKAAVASTKQEDIVLVSLTFGDTRYTFETYREYSSYAFFERKIDKTDFFDDKTNLNIGDST